MKVKRSMEIKIKPTTPINAVSNVKLTIELYNDNSNNVFSCHPVDRWREFENDTHTEEFNHNLIDHINNHLFRTDNGLMFKVKINSVSVNKKKVGEKHAVSLMSNIVLDINKNIEVISYDIRKEQSEQFTVDLISRVVLAETIKFMDRVYIMRNTENALQFNISAENKYYKVENLISEWVGISRLLSDCCYAKYPTTDYNGMTVSAKIKDAWSDDNLLSSWYDVMVDSILDDKLCNRLKSNKYISFKTLVNSMNKILGENSIKYTDFKLYDKLTECLIPAEVDVIQIRFINEYNLELLIPFRKNWPAREACTNDPDYVSSYALNLFINMMYLFLLKSSDLSEEDVHVYNIISDFNKPYTYKYTLSNINTNKITSESSTVGSNMI